MSSSPAPVTSLSAFGDKATPPDARGLRRTLGKSAAAWEELVRVVEERYAPATEQWNFAGAKYGWSVRLKQRERVVLYLIPQQGRFLVGIVLGGKAVAAVREAGLPADVLDLIASAPRYAEGTGVRLPVTNRSALPPILTLVALKMARY